MQSLVSPTWGSRATHCLLLPISAQSLKYVFHFKKYNVFQTIGCIMQKCSQYPLVSYFSKSWSETFWLLFNCCWWEIDKWLKVMKVAAPSLGHCSWWFKHAYSLIWDVQLDDFHYFYLIYTISLWLFMPVSSQYKLHVIGAKLS